MQDPSSDPRLDALIGELHPLAAQAASVVAYLADVPEGIGRSDRDLAARIGSVSAEHVAIVRRSLLSAGLAVRTNFEARLVCPSDILKGVAQNLRGVASYLRAHRDRDTVELV